MSTSMTTKQMPSQKKSDSEKLKDDNKWGKECVDSGEGMIFLQSDFIRSSRYRKLINYDLYAGKLHEEDVERIVNPMNIKNQSFPTSVQNHPITNPYIKCLVGDEINRRFDWNLKVTNDDAISEKEKEKSEIANQELQAILLQGLEQPQIDPNTPEGQQAAQQYEQEVAKRLEQLNSKVNQNFQDKREIAGTHLLNHYQRALAIKSTRTRAWEDALLVGEELYCVDIIANEPIVRKCNPNNTHFLLAPDDYMIEDSELIVEEDYVPISKIIDNHYDELTAKDIEFLESKTGYAGMGSYGNLLQNELTDPIFAIPLGANQAIDLTSFNTTGNGGLLPFDSLNNVRRVRVSWRSLRKIGILTSIDNNGESLESIVHEDYEVRKELGEKIRFVWIGEWWEGTKIANSIYLKIQPKPVQFRKLNNLSHCASGYVGSLYKTNSSTVQSLFDLMKPSQYKYNIYYHRLEKLLVNNIGKVATFDFARMPDNWNVDKWLYYMKEMNIAVTDSFKEAKKGQATGKLAGNMSSQQNVLDLSLGNEIQQIVQLLEYVKSELDLITGITPQRRGQMKAADPGLGVTQQSIQSSSAITEWYFKRHDETGLRLMATLLETAKYCLRNGNKNIQYITDDMDSVIYNIDGELINEAEYGLVMVDSTQDAKARQSLAQATEIAMQTGQVDIIQYMEINSNESYASIKRKIEKSVREKQEQADKARQEENQIAQAELTEKKEERKQRLELDKYRIDVEANTRLAVANITVMSRQEDLDIDNNGILDPSEIAANALKQQELLSKQFDNDKKHVLESNKLKQEKDFKDKELAFKEKELKTKKEIEVLKAKTAIRNKVAGQK